MKKAEEAKDALKAAVEKNELNEIREKKDALQEIVQNLSVKLYEEAAKQAQAQQDGEGANEDDNIVDAEFEEVEDDKKVNDEIVIKKPKPIKTALAFHYDL